MGLGMGDQTPASQRKAAAAAGGGGLAALKLLLCVLLVGLALRLLDGPSAYLLSDTATATAAPEGEVASDGARVHASTVVSNGTMLITACFWEDEMTNDSRWSCDLSHGEWVPDSLGPSYTNGSCRFIEMPQNCMTNGRPDSGYLYWRWKPYGCDVPRFEGEKFLEAMRGKHWALIGDSILRNHVQSLLCLLAKVEEPTQVYHDRTFKSRRWHFASHNITVSLIWAPFLVEAEIFEDDDGRSTSELQLHLDILDSNWTRQWNSFDYVVISTGQWFPKTAVYWEDGVLTGCHYCKNKNIAELTFEYAFRKSLRKAFQFITSSPHKPVVFYRTWSPSHFENGEWSSGGTCKRTVPFKPGEAGDRESDKKMWRIEREEFAKAAAHDRSNNAGRLKLLDTFELSLLRPDGHSGPYRTYHPFDKGTTSKVQNDCLHWCLPGPIDAWNDIIMEMLEMN
uniref:Uncharacterized protein n=1 Tax=Oryza brachyantha TaxID=4533 RepID=J3MEM3_ORYBR